MKGRLSKKSSWENDLEGHVFIWHTGERDLDDPGHEHPGKVSPSYHKSIVMKQVGEYDKGTVRVKALQIPF